MNKAAVMCLRTWSSSSGTHWSVWKPAGFNGSVCLGAICVFSLKLRGHDRKWRHLLAQRYNGDHIAVTLGSLYRHPPLTTHPPLTPPLLILSGKGEGGLLLLCSGQQQHHNQTTETLNSSHSPSSVPRLPSSTTSSHRFYFKRSG